MGKNEDSILLHELKEAGGGFLDHLALKILLRIVRLLYQYKKLQYDRTVSFGDLLVDRREKARFLNFGEGTTIYDSSLVIGDVKVGKNTWIGPFTLLDGSGGLIIGDYCSISAGVQVYTHDTVKWALSAGKSGYRYSSVSIGNYCYIGPHTIISKGVKIGSYCKIGANSLVNRDIGDHSVAVGSPCRIIGTVDPDAQDPGKDEGVGLPCFEQEE